MALPPIPLPDLPGHRPADFTTWSAAVAEVLRPIWGDRQPETIAMAVIHVRGNHRGHLDQVGGAVVDAMAAAGVLVAPIAPHINGMAIRCGMDRSALFFLGNNTDHGS